MSNVPSLGTVLRYAWAAPASGIGLLLAAPALATGIARAAWHTGVLEVSLADERWRGRARAWPFVAITFGHVVLAQSRRTQRLVRAHERVHVAQYERLGPLFLLAYPLESLLQLLRGSRPYLDNRFEREARRLS
jgi:hypothetical protein